MDTPQVINSSRILFTVYSHWRNVIILAESISFLYRPTDWFFHQSKIKEDFRLAKE
jgi:hypothetical protein